MYVMKLDFGFKRLDQVRLGQVRLGFQTNMEMLSTDIIYMVVNKIILGQVTESDNMGNDLN